MPGNWHVRFLGSRDAATRPGYPTGGPKCRHDHQLKQDPRWHATQHPDGTFTWTTPAGRKYTTGPTEYPT